MKKVFCIFAVAGIIAACTPKDASTIENAVFSVEDVLCILNHDTIDNSAIATACSISQALQPAIAQVISAHKAGLARQAGCAK